MLPIYNQPLAMLTDLYQLTMAYGYWKLNRIDVDAVFHLFFRRAPYQGGFTIASGLENVISFLESFKFTDSDLSYLATLKGSDDLPLFDPAFLDYLGQLKITLDVDALPEGSVVFPYEPLVRVKGPLIQCQLMETPLLNLINFPTLISTKGARMRLAAGDDPIIEFGLRRAQGIDGGLTASRSAYIGGVDSTSNLLAGKHFDIPVKGTHAHSWVLAFDDELESFKAYAEAMPNNCVLLVDTFDTLEGVKNAIEIGKWLRSKGKTLLGIRLDSGDLAHLSIASRQLLDEAGLEDVVIVASNELDETIISDLKRQGAKIACWGVGTKLVTGGEQAALDGVYKLSAVRSPGKEWQYKLKLSEQLHKISNPGQLQIRRYFKNGVAQADVIYDEQLGIGEMPEFIDPLDATKKRKLPSQLTYKDLLVPIYRNGKLVYQPPKLDQIRNQCKENIAHFPIEIKRFINPHQFPVGFEKEIHELKLRLISQARIQYGGLS